MFHNFWRKGVVEHRCKRARAVADSSCGTLVGAAAAARLFDLAERRARAVPSSAAPTTGAVIAGAVIAGAVVPGAVVPGGMPATESVPVPEDVPVPEGVPAPGVPMIPLPPILFSQRDHPLSRSGHQ